MTEQHNIESTWRRLFSFKNKTSQKSNTKHVLIVDDEKPFLLSLSDGLSPYKKDGGYPLNASKLIPNPLILNDIDCF
jgi:hypothetical protein